MSLGESTLGISDNDDVIAATTVTGANGADSGTNIAADTVLDGPPLTPDAANSAVVKAQVLAELRELLHAEAEQQKHVRGAAVLFQAGGEGLLDTLARSRNPNVVRVAMAFRTRLKRVGALAGVGGVEAFFAVFAEMFSQVADEELAAEQRAEKKVAQTA